MFPLHPPSFRLNCRTSTDEKLKRESKSFRLVSACKEIFIAKSSSIKKREGSRWKFNSIRGWDSFDVMFCYASVFVFVRRTMTRRTRLMEPVRSRRVIASSEKCVYGLSSVCARDYDDTKGFFFHRLTLNMLMISESWWCWNKERWMGKRDESSGGAKVLWEKVVWTRPGNARIKH